MKREVMFIIGVFGIVGLFVCGIMSMNDKKYEDMSLVECLEVADSNKQKDKCYQMFEDWLKYDYINELLEEGK